MKTSERIKRMVIESSAPIFLRSDFSELGGRSQVSYSLKQMVADKLLVRVSQGIYVRTRINRFTTEIMLDVKGGADAAFLQILKRLDIEHEFTGLTKAYFDREVAQIPAKMQIKLKKRLRRKIVICENAHP